MTTTKTQTQTQIQTNTNTQTKTQTRFGESCPPIPSSLLPLPGALASRYLAEGLFRRHAHDRRPRNLPVVFPVLAPLCGWGADAVVPLVAPTLVMHGVHLRSRSE
jgi:hypothetical protein